MNYYHTYAGDVPRISVVDYNGYKFNEVIGEDRFRQKRQAVADYKRKLRLLIAECQNALACEIEFDEDIIC